LPDEETLAFGATIHFVKHSRILEKIETTDDAGKLKVLEERRVELHWEFIELLKQQGIKYKDREHATRIAIRVAKEEL